MNDTHRHTLMQGPVLRWVCAALLALPAMAVQVALTQGLAERGVALGAAVAQEQQAAKKKRKTRRTPALRNKVYEKLAKVQENIESKQYNAALGVLRDMENESGKRALNSYELANLHNYYAFVYYSMEDYPNALRSYQKVVSQPDIPLAMEVNTRYTIAQLYFVMERWQRGIDALGEWFAVADNPSAQAYILLGQGYYQLKDYKKSLRNTLRAINMYRDKGKIPKEQWYSLARYLYHEKGDTKNTLATLEELVTHYPKKQYWVQLSYMYGEVENEKGQLGAMETVYEQDLLVKDREQVNMAYLYLNAGVPYKAAKVLDKGLANDTVEDSSKTLEILGNSWRQAQETEKSVPVMEKAAEKSDKGELYCRLGNLYLDNEQFKEAIKANSEGLRRGGVKRPDNCRLVLGMAYFNTKQYKRARAAFEKAAEDERSLVYADQWIRYMDNELARQRALSNDI